MRMLIRGGRRRRKMAGAVMLEGKVCSVWQEEEEHSRHSAGQDFDIGVIRSC